MYYIWILLLAAWLLPHAPAWAAEALEGEVVGISDGDTITVLTPQKHQVKVRLYGIDCPESKQAYGSRARQAASDMVFRRRVSVDVVDRDRYGRTVGIVTAPGGAVLNRELVASGMAWIYTAYCKRPVCDAWRGDEAKARAARRGLWADASPVPPWEFRRAGRAAARPENSQRIAPAASYSGNTLSGVFHAAGCRYFDCGRCTARFASRGAALGAGYRPCGVCRP